MRKRSERAGSRVESATLSQDEEGVDDQVPALPTSRVPARFAQWARRNLKLLLDVTVGMVGVTALATLVLAVTFPPTAFRWWLLGALQTAMVAAYLHLLHAAFLAHDGEAIWHLRSAWGEDNTRSELQRARHKGLIWGWVDSISLQAGDLDHLVVTRNGGLVAIDSKWRNQASDTIDMARAAKKARLRAEALAHSLLTGNRGARHRAKTAPCGSPGRRPLGRRSAWRPRWRTGGRNRVRCRPASPRLAHQALGSTGRPSCGDRSPQAARTPSRCDPGQDASRSGLTRSNPPCHELHRQAFAFRWPPAQ